MLERYSRIRTEEVSRNGLIILAAVYGKIVDGIVCKIPFFIRAIYIFIGFVSALDYI
jgi:hypothetical protein